VLLSDVGSNAGTGTCPTTSEAHARCTDVQISAALLTCVPGPRG
jgi:hypothetical protein